MLFILLISSVYAVVMLNEPWHWAETIENIPEAEVDARFRVMGKLVSPDGTQKLSRMFPVYPGFGVYDASLQTRIYSVEGLLAGFYSDSEIHTLDRIDRIDKGTIQFNIRVYKRRYAYSFLGYMTRPEVLLTLLFSCLLAWLLLRHHLKIRAKKFSE
ncbi:MAG TPA: hypothetical protein VKX17_02780 [Planctomycetota bacterium]|nr:hypothetical protein [Planctomycetota bacterium]